MHILLGLLAVIAVAIFILYRIQRASRATTAVIDMTDDVRAAIRRFGFTGLAQQDPLDALDDPRAAAAGVLTAIAALEGDLTREQTDAIQRECASLFGVDRPEAADLYAIGRWLVRQRGPDEALRRLTPQLSAKLNTDEAQDLLTSCRAVAEAHTGKVDDLQNQAMLRLQRELR